MDSVLGVIYHPLQNLQKGEPVDQLTQHEHSVLINNRVIMWSAPLIKINIFVYRALQPYYMVLTTVHFILLLFIGRERRTESVILSIFAN